MSFAFGLPKAELHVHHVGSASQRTVSELAARYEGDSPVPADPGCWPTTSGSPTSVTSSRSTCRSST
ncbi:hypothetical protein ACHMWU_25540 [Aeromicrobium sp. UC242_57]